MSRRFVDYDLLAEGYDRRYASNRLDGIAAALREILVLTASESVLELGCGTGRWLSELARDVRLAVGLDLSLGMLRGFRGAGGRMARVCASATLIPFRSAVFDLVAGVNVLHHFEDPAAAIAEATRILRPAGAVAVVGLDPHQARNRWYLYEFFPETRALDLERYPPVDQVRQWMVDAGLKRVETVGAERVERQLTGGEVLQDYFLQRQSCSQLAMLTEAAWASGLQRIRESIQAGEASGEPPVFEVDLSLDLVCGWKPASVR